MKPEERAPIELDAVALNQAGWVFIDAWNSHTDQVMSGNTWNNTKPMLEAAIRRYLEITNPTSTEKSVHDTIRDAAQSAWDKYKICVKEISISWAITDTIGSDLEVTAENVKMETITMRQRADGRIDPSTIRKQKEK